MGADRRAQGAVLRLILLASGEYENTIDEQSWGVMRNILTAEVLGAALMTPPTATFLDTAADYRPAFDEIWRRLRLHVPGYTL